VESCCWIPPAVAWSTARPTSLPASYHDAIRGKPVNPESDSLQCGGVLKEQVIVADAASDPRWSAHGWRRAGIRARVERVLGRTPDSGDGWHGVGTFALYGRKPGGPTPQLQNVIGQMTHVATVAIDGHGRWPHYKRVRSGFAAMADAISELIWITDWNRRAVLYASPKFRRIWGLRLDALYANPRLWTDPIHPETVPASSTRSRGGLVAMAAVSTTSSFVSPSRAARFGGFHERGVTNCERARQAVCDSGISTDDYRAPAVRRGTAPAQSILAEAERVSLTGQLGWAS